MNNIFENNRARTQNNLKAIYGSNEIQKSFAEQALKADEIIKGKRATIGEVREWKDGKYQRTATGWVAYKGDSKGKAEPKTEGKKDNKTQNKFSNHSNFQLAQLADNAGNKEAALEIERRKKEYEGKKNTESDSSENKDVKSTPSSDSVNRLTDMWDEINRKKAAKRELGINEKKESGMTLEEAKKNLQTLEQSLEDAYNGDDNFVPSSGDLEAIKDAEQLVKELEGGDKKPEPKVAKKELPIDTNKANPFEGNGTVKDLAYKEVKGDKEIVLDIWGGSTISFKKGIGTIGSGGSYIVESMSITDVDGNNFHQKMGQLKEKLILSTAGKQMGKDKAEKVADELIENFREYKGFPAKIEDKSIEKELKQKGFNFTENSDGWQAVKGKTQIGYSKEGDYYFHNTLSDKGPSWNHKGEAKPKGHYTFNAEEIKSVISNMKKESAKEELGIGEGGEVSQVDGFLKKQYKAVVENKDNSKTEIPAGAMSHASKVFANNNGISQDEVMDLIQSGVLVHGTEVKGGQMFYSFKFDPKKLAERVGGKSGSDSKVKKEEAKKELGIEGKKAGGKATKQEVISKLGNTISYGGRTFKKTEFGDTVAYETRGEVVTDDYGDKWTDNKTQDIAKKLAEKIKKDFPNNSVTVTPQEKGWVDIQID